MRVSSARFAMTAKAGLISIAVSAVVLVAPLSGCSESALRARMARDARDDLLGLSRQGLIACAGAPARQERIGDREFLTYVSDPELEPDTCVATFVLRRQLVDRLDYTSPSGMLPRQPERCGYIIAGCMPEKDAIDAGAIGEASSPAGS